MEQFIQKVIDWLKQFKKVRESKVGLFLITTLAELQKVTWPSKDDVKTSTVVTIVVMVLMALYMGGAQAIVEVVYDQVRRLVS